MTKTRIPYIVPLITGSFALFIPLIGTLHVDSALLASLGGCFWAGWSACSAGGGSRNDVKEASILSALVLLAGLPLLAGDVVTGCFSTDGLLFWLVYPVPSVFLGYAAGRMVRRWHISQCRLWTIFGLTVPAFVVPLYELLSYPQIYLFNHVWGGWPGPIYDESAGVNSATFYFRLLTVLWIFLLWNIPAAVDKHRRSLAVVMISVAGLAIGYTQLDRAGVLSSYSYLQETLGGHVETDNFDIYYDRRSYSDDEISRIALEHEFYLDRITRILQVDKPGADNRIESYLYAHAWQKKKLVGAKFTSYVPVWLERDQLHIAKQQLGSLEHEMVHVLAKSFGNRLFNASWSVGMIEGLAVAIAGGSSSHSTIDQMVVAEKPYPGADELKRTFSPLGFYAGRSGVNYTTSGSFVRFLLHTYPVKNLKKAYRTADLTGALQTDWETLTKRWHVSLDTVAIDSIDRRVAGRIFGIPSLFEQTCPRVQTPFARVWDSYRLHRAEKDTAGMLQSLDEAIQYAPASGGVQIEWAFYHLVSGADERVCNRASLQDSTIELQLLYADACRLDNRLEEARMHIDRAESLLAANPDSLLIPALDVRSDDKQWNLYNTLRYRHYWLSDDEFRSAHYRTKIRAVRQAFEQNNSRRIAGYADLLLERPLQPRYFDLYLDLVHYFGYRTEFQAATSWLERLTKLPLRARYRERLQKEKEWINFMESLSAERENISPGIRSSVSGLGRSPSHLAAFACLHEALTKGQS